jgi:BirA family biotin operon repressor/biotin-[acetyl-CoA-carboxylase] ligase
MLLPHGWSLQYRPSTGSTNDDAKVAARNGCPDLTVFVTGQQTAGRGRFDRRWLSTQASSLLFSILLRRRAPPVLLTAACAVAVVDGLRDQTGLDAQIKWPNDVMVGPRKLCGILTEIIVHEAAPVAIVGVGINVNLNPSEAGLPSTATSISEELGREVPRWGLLERIVHRLAGTLGTSDGSGGGFLGTSLMWRWEQLLWRRRQTVRIDQGGLIAEGVVLGLTPTGALRVRSANGETTEISVGELLPD